MWWGGGGGQFKWSHYQSPEAITAILDTTARQLLDFGAQVLVLMAGHYPWQSFLDQVVPALREDYPDDLILAGTEVSICGDAVMLKGDHAAREKTSLGLALFAQMGEDAREASNEHGEQVLATVIDHLAQTIKAFTDRESH